MRHLAQALLVLTLGLTAAGCGLGGLVGGLVATSVDGGSSDNQAPPPTISAASPNSGTHAGGMQITIDGTNFSKVGDQAPQVSIGGTNATSVVVQDSTRLTAVVPASTTVGPVAVQVTSPSGGTATLAGGFTYTNQLPVATISPLTGLQSQNVVFTVTLADPEGDPLDLRFFYSRDGGAWQVISSTQILSGGTTSVASSKTGIAHNLTWDSRSVFNTDNAQVRLRAVPVDTSDGMEGTGGDSNEFTITNNTPVDVIPSQPGTDSFEVVFSYAVSDPDSSDPVQVTALTYRDVNSGATGSLTLKAGQSTGSVPFSEGGLLSDSVWDSLTDLGFGNNHLIELSVTVSDGTFTRTRTTQPFFIHNGPLSQPTSASTQLFNANYVAGDVASETRKLVHGTVTGGPFVLGEVLTGGASGRTATVDRLGQGYLLVRGESGAFTIGETITGGSSSASAPLTSLSPFPPLPDVVACADMGNGAPGRVAIVKSTGVGFDSPSVSLAPNIPGLPVPGSSTNLFLSGYAHPAECSILDVDGDGLVDLVAAEHDPSVSVTNLLTLAGADAGTGFANVRAHQVTLIAKQVAGTLSVSSGVYESAQADRSAIAPHVRVTGQSATTYPPAATGNPSLDNLGWFCGATTARDVSAPGTPSAGHPDLVVLHRVRQLGSAFGGDVNGVVVVRQYNPGTKQLDTPIYLDPTDMGALPTHVAVADITSDAHTAANGGLPGDGRAVPAGTPDLIVVNLGDSSLTFYLQVSPATNPPTYVSCKLALSSVIPGLPVGDPVGVAIGDLNGDGYNDFVISTQATKRAFVFVYDTNAAATGTLLTQPTTFGLVPFRLAGSVSLPGGATRPVISDLSGDGKADIVVPLALNNEIVLLVNHGTFAGTPVFGPAPTYAAKPIRFPANFGPSGAFVADFNSDGAIDLGVGAANQAASVYYQATPGTLDPAVPIPTGNGPIGLASAELTGDGVLDLVVPLQGDNTVQRFRRGTSSLLELDATIDLTTYADPSPATLVVSTPLSAQPVDLSGDGNLDHLLTAVFVVAGPGVNTGGWERIPAGGSSVAAVRTTVTGTFHAAGLSSDGGDFLYGGGTPDGIPDVVTGTSDGLQLYRGLGGFAYGAPQVLSAGSIFTGVQVVDLDQDGHLDVVVAVNQQGMGVFYNGGHPAGSIAYGTLPASPVMLDLQGIPSASYFDVRDLGGPGAHRDIAFANFNGAGAGVLYQTSARVFQIVPMASGGEPGQVATGDLNGDGLADIVIPWGSDNLLAVYYRNPSATGLADNFRAPALFPTSQNPIGVTVYDVDGDNRLDAVVSCRGANVLNVFRQR